MSDVIKYKYIAIEGNIGVGKTTLAKRLANLVDSKIVLERFRKNYFLPLFYNDMDKYSLHVELSFLVDRYEDHSNLFGESQTIISDYFFPKTLLFAKSTLDKHSYKIFERVYKNFEQKAIKPDLVIFLKRDITHLLKNIKNRKRTNEKKINPEYLLKIQNSYDKYLNNSTGYKILSLDITDVNLKNKAVLEKIVLLLNEDYKYGITVIKF